MPRAGPSSPLDPGWLFIIAGLAMCAAWILIPADNALLQVTDQLEQLQREDAALAERLRAHSEFLDELDRAEPALVRRLAATQLNLIPEGQKPVVRAQWTSASVMDWVDSTVAVPAADRHVREASFLSRVVEGPNRLWVLGAAVMCILFGLLTGDGGSRANGAEGAPERSEHESIFDQDETGAGAAGSSSSTDMDDEGEQGVVAGSMTGEQMAMFEVGISAEALAMLEAIEADEVRGSCMPQEGWGLKPARAPRAEPEPVLPALPDEFAPELEEEEEVHALPRGAVNPEVDAVLSAIEAEDARCTKESAASVDEHEENDAVAELDEDDDEDEDDDFDEEDEDGDEFEDEDEDEDEDDVDLEEDEEEDEAAFEEEDDGEDEDEFDDDDEELIEDEASDPDGDEEDGEYEDDEEYEYVWVYEDADEDDDEDEDDEPLDEDEDEDEEDQP